jgi:RNA-binding motif X-linked protein 2
VHLQQHTLLKRETFCTIEDGESDSSASSGPEIDPEDPMYEYLIAQRKEAKALKKVKKSKSKGKHKDETPEERKARKERKRAKKQKKLEARGGRGRNDRRTDQEKSLEELLAELEGDVPMRAAGRTRSRTPERRWSPPPRGEQKTRSRSRTPPLRSDRPRSRSRSRTPVHRGDRRRSRSPRRMEDRRARPEDRERDHDSRRR